MWSQVIFPSEITTVDNTQILHEAWVDSGNTTPNSTDSCSQWTWPTVPKPVKRVWRLWKAFVQTHCSNKLNLTTSLGQWHCHHHKTGQWKCVHDDKCVHLGAHQHMQQQMTMVTMTKSHLSLWQECTDDVPAETHPAMCNSTNDLHKIYPRTRQT